jgi:mono/diheme cytochrome c family protein
MKLRSTPALLLAGSGVLSLSGCNRDPTPLPEPSRTPEPAAAFSAPLRQPSRLSGEAVYRKYCAVCHGDDGSGRNGAASFVGAGSPLAKPDAALLASIRDGVRRDTQSMPGHKGLLSDAELADTLAYVRKSFGKRAAR